MFGGGALFLMSFYLAGAAGVPRRYAIEPAPGPFFANIATIGALVLFVGFILAASEALRLARLKPVDVPL
jgi:heme/copper-type cytochrome/quinol oxidase subunit 1